MSSARKATEKTRSNQRAGILAIDYGQARMGLAVTEAGAGLPRPLTTLERVNRNEDMRRLREILREHGIREVVVGLPLRLDGTRGPMAEEATGFATRVRKQLGVPVEMIDERLTSWEAERLLEEQVGRVSHKAPEDKGKRKKLEGANSVDAVAAAVILKEYLERQASTGALRKTEGQARGRLH